MLRLNAFARISLLIVILAMIAGGLALMSQPPVNIYGLLLLLTGVIGFGAYSEWLARGRSTPSFNLSSLLQRDTGRIIYQFMRYIPFTLGIGLLIYAFALFKEPEAQPWFLLMIWLASLTSLQLGAFAFANTREHQIIDRQLWAAWEVPFLTLITIIALTIRVSAIEYIPYAIDGDEGEMGLVARSILAGSIRQPFATEWLGHPTLWFFLQAAALTLLGDNIAGLRTLSALFGAAAIPITYLFARASFGRIIAIGSVILLAGLSAHIHFSRVGLNNIVDPTLGTASFALLLYGWQRGKVVALFGSGLLLGLAQHSYFGARLLIVIMGLLVLHLLWSQRTRWFIHIRELLMVLLGFVAGVGPLLRFYSETPELYIARMSNLGFFRSDYLAQRMSEGETYAGIVASQVLRGLGAYTIYPDVGLFYAAPQPILTGIGAVCFLCGLAIACWRIREATSFLLFAWVCCTAILGGSMLIDTPQTTRYVIAMPAVCVLVLYGVQRVLTLLWDVLGIQRGRTIIVLITSVWLSLQGVIYYFGDYNQKYYYSASPALTQIAYYIQARDSSEQIFFLGAPYIFYAHGTIRFLAPEVRGTDVLDPITNEAQVPAPDSGIRAVYIAVPARVDELTLIQARYPGGKLRSIANLRDPGIPAFIAYEAP